MHNLTGRCQEKGSQEQQNMEHDKLTVLSRVSNGGFGLRAFSHLIKQPAL